jgi:MYXO-CTERM domain-containing protein
MGVSPRIARGTVLALALLCARATHATESVPPGAPTPILGGDVVPACGFPTTVSVGGFCSGTLVHPRVVVYAAHCGDEVPFIRFGDRIAKSPGFEVAPQTCATHPIGEFGFGTDAAYCVLSEPLDDIPIAPPLMGCEAEAALQVGQPVTVVGFGLSDDELEPYGVKRRLDTTINALSWDEVFIGGVDEGVCYGDSGGPTYVRLEGGEWRSFGITSWGQPGCGYGGYLSTIVHNIDWLEEASGVDITPCHDGLGNWDRGPDCTGFELDPLAIGGDWDGGCDFGPVGGPESTCGPAFDPTSEDLVAPGLSFVSPEPYSRFDPPEGETQVNVFVEVAAADGDGWGVGAIELVIVDEDGSEVARIADPTAPFVFDNLVFPGGVWTLRAEADDRAGNAGVSDDLVFGVGEDPPEPTPDPDTTSGSASASSSSDGGTSSSEGGSSDEDATSSGDDTSGAPPADGDSGCGCAAASNRSFALLGVLALLAWRRRRSLALAAALAACGDSTATPSSEDDGSTDGGESTTTTAPADTSTTTVDSSSDAPLPEPDMGSPPDPGCGNGIVEGDEICDDGNLVSGDGCSAQCVPSGSPIEQWLWPERDPESFGTDLALQIDGTYVALASRIGTGTAHVAVVLGFDADGTVAWATESAAALENEEVWPRAIAIDPAGTIVAVGYLERDLGMDDVIEPWIGRFEPDGTETWSLSETGAPGQIYSDVVFGPSGDPIAIGSRELADASFRFAARRHAFADGAAVWEIVEPDEAVGAAGLGATMTADDEVVVVGWRSSSSGRDVWLSRFDEDGAPIDETTFGEPLTYYYPRVVHVGEDGDAIVCGSVVRASAENALIGRFTLGAAEPKVWMERIEPPGPGISSCEGFAVDDDGRIAIGGLAFDADESYEHLFARLSADGEILWTARLGAIEGYSYDGVEAVLLDSEGDILALGTSQNSASRYRVWIGRVTG